MRKSYPSDISRDQFEVIKPLLESARRKTSLRRVDLYKVFCSAVPAQERLPVAHTAR